MQINAYITDCRCQKRFEDIFWMCHVNINLFDEHFYILSYIRTVPIYMYDQIPG